MQNLLQIVSHGKPAASSRCQNPFKCSSRRGWSISWTVFKFYNTVQLKPLNSWCYQPLNVIMFRHFLKIIGYCYQPFNVIMNTWSESYYIQRLTPYFLSWSSNLFIIIANIFIQIDQKSASVTTSSCKPCDRQFSSKRALSEHQR